MKQSKTIELLAACLLALSMAACQAAGEGKSVPAPAGSASLPGDLPPAYSAFLEGDRSFMADGQTETWWIPDFHSDGFPYEYACLELDGEGEKELVIQMAGDPCGYNGVFHLEDGKIVCWNSDGAEMSCRDYPLQNGVMVRQYDFNGSRHYTLFRYLPNGETEPISQLFAREELIPADSSEPCPYYEVDGEETDEAAFSRQVESLVTSRLLEPSSWTAFPALHPEET